MWQSLFYSFKRCMWIINYQSNYFSELALVEFGCRVYSRVMSAKVLVRGLGVGFARAAPRKATSISSQVVVAKLIPEA